MSNEVTRHIAGIFKSLMSKTESGYAIWQSRGGVRTIDLGEFSISIEQVPSDDISPTYCGRITWQDGTVAGEAVVRVGDSEYDVFKKIHDEAQGASIKAIADIVEELGSGTDVIGELPPSPPPPPTLPTSQLMKDFFAKVKGDWTLNFSSGKEEVTIDENGHYFAKGRNAIPNKPNFILRLIFCDSGFTEVEWAKYDPHRRKNYQIEVLKVKESELSGFVKHDGRKLHYKKLEGRP